MSSKLDNPEHWRELAREARTVARATGNPEVRASMLIIAAEYDKVADNQGRSAELYAVE
jgi:hypothetical protein